MLNRAPLMAAGLLMLSGLAWVLAADPAAPVSATPEEAASDPDFALQGEYTAADVGVQIVALGKGQFTTVILRGGLPGAGWNEKERQAVEEDADGVRELIDVLKLKKIERSSPTLGALPPRGSQVLFDGTPETLEKQWQPGAKITKDGLLQQGCTTRDGFRDYTIHIEFRLPYQPTARGQGRGNSGLYFAQRYEVQMLDSFGLEGKDNECGGLYSMKNPDVNMCLPPLTWQTYDADFTAARFNDKGERISPARMTVRHNGVVVHQNVELPEKFPAAPQDKETTDARPIFLQDHGNPVRYRNIWVLPRDLEQEARRPIVPAFERFAAAGGANAVNGGRLLLGELNCTACHAASGPTADRLIPRPAPVLDQIGQRVRPEFLIDYLSHPHATKPGAVMPDLLGQLPEPQRKETVLALVNYLVSTGTIAEQSTDRQAAQRGEKTYREFGCTACHAPRSVGDAPLLSVNPATTVPLPDLATKYSVASLAAFLQDPHKTRPAGRMPAFPLDNNAARDLACFLMGDVEARPRNPNMKFTVYHGSWAEIPNFDEVKAVKTGESAGLDLTVAGRTSDFGVRFDGFLKIAQEGDYTFHLGSDDGSLLVIDGKKVLDNGGIHPHSVKTGRVKLTAGVHPVRVDYTQGGGEWTLDLEYEGPGVPRQSAAMAMMLTPEGNPPPPPPPADAPPPFVFNPDLVPAGRTQFASLGCASCHTLPALGQPSLAPLPAPPLEKLNLERGCLINAATADDGRALPRYDLNLNQQEALRVALTAAAVAAQDAPPQEIGERTHQTLLAFNCYACHSRGGVGGPERDRNPLFLTTIPEMGDEGRIPPPLDGVGDKLQDNWLRHVLQNGARDRPYMLTRMPKFGLDKLGPLPETLIVADRRTEAVIPTLSEAAYRVKSTGRQLVGDKALACIKCHTFGQHRASGIQAIDLQSMASRVRDDWFFRYMVDPPQYRPGTRMPTGFPDGKSTIKEVYEGDPNHQLAAIWTYLKDGAKAGVPEGVVGNVIELKPETEPIIFRNFLEGLSPRGIAVGYPEKGHLAWDADKMCLTQVWHGRFIDAGLHWEGRGSGRQGPLGDHVMRLEETAPIAILDSQAAEWPKEAPKDRGYTFTGYMLDGDRRPHFRYRTEQFSVEDFPKPVSHGTEGTFERHLMITAKADVGALHFLAAAGEKIEPQPDGWFLVNGTVRLRITGGGEPVVRESAGRRELIVPLNLKDGKAEIVEEIVW